MRFNKLFSVIAVIFSLGLSGCGGGGGGASGSSDGTSTGVFLDAPVEGLYYSTPTQSGYTNNKGEFTYKSGETVTFKLGNLTLGSSAASATVTPIEISGDTSLNTIGTKATNIARILQSLSENSDDSRIVIPSTIKNIDLSDLSLESDADISTMVSRANTITGKNKTLVSAATATANMKSNVQNNIFGTYDGTFSLTNQLVDTSIFSCYSSGSSSVTITANGASGFKATGLISSDSVSLYFNGIKNTTISNSKYSLTNTTLNGQTITGNYTITSSSVEVCSGSFSLSKRILDSTPPVFTSPSSITVNENQTSAITLQATDANTITYSISGDDISYFNINTSTGAVIFKEDADYENKTSYTFVATAKDGYGNIETQTVTINLTDQTDIAPTFSSDSSLDIVELNTSKILDLAVNGTNTLITYYLSGTDNSYFTLSGTEISFNILTDYDNPVDLDLNNIYLLTANVNDSAGNHAEQNISIRVLPTFEISGSDNDYNRTIVDNRTNLMWEDSNKTIELRSDNQPPQYCNNLVYAGYDDWRLPTLEEFQYILKTNVKEKTSNTFKYFSTDYYRTSSYYSAPSSGFTIPRAQYYFIKLSGETKQVDWAYIDEYYARCIREN